VHHFSHKCLLLNLSWSWT